MKILVFTDIHGNLELLKALFSTQDFLESDLRICLGDCIDLDMPNNECLELLRAHDVICTYGNYEARLFDWFEEPSKQKPKFVEKNALIKSSLDDGSLRFLGTFCKEFTLDLGKAFTFCHYKWKDNYSLVERLEPTKEYISHIYSGVKSDYIICGHDHNTYHYYDGKDMICIGSLGLKCPAPYVIIEADLPVDDFMQHNIEYKEHCKKVDVVGATPQIEVEGVDTQILSKKDGFTITLKLMHYSLDFLKQIYPIPKFIKRNFNLNISIQ